jgi:Alkylmercury lyase
MCAFDALGIPYMLNEHGEVQAQEPNSRRIVRVS